jgi:hypothetical protein
MRHHSREEILQRGGIGNQLFVKVARIPVDEDMAYVEDDRARPRQRA